MSDYDDLFGGNSLSFDKTLTADQRAWCEGLADVIVDQEREPNWVRAAAAYRVKFDTELPKSEGTLKMFVRKLVAKRDG